MPLRGEGVFLQQLFNISQRSASLYNRAISGTRMTQTGAGGSDCLKEIWMAMVIPVSLSLLTPYHGYPLVNEHNHGKNTIFNG